MSARMDWQASRLSAIGLACALLAASAAVDAQATTLEPVPANAEASAVTTPAADPSAVMPIPIDADPVPASGAPAADAATATLAPASATQPAADPAAPTEASAEASGAPASVFAAEQTDDSARKYCTNIADAAADARFARQAQALAELEKQIDERIKALETKRGEYEDWLTRREHFLRKADESVVAIFTQMRPDAAAQQMSVMDMGAAAAILAKLNPRIAGAILSEMDPAKAAELTTTMAGLARPSDGAETPG